MTHIGTGQNRLTTKQAESAEIELLTLDYLQSGGQINCIEVIKSEYAPVWADYTSSALETCDENLRSL